MLRTRRYKFYCKRYPTQSESPLNYLAPVYFSLSFSLFHAHPHASYHQSSNTHTRVSYSCFYSIYSRKIHSRRSVGSSPLQTRADSCPGMQYMLKKTLRLILGVSGAAFVALSFPTAAAGFCAAGSCASYRRYLQAIL